MKTNWIVNNTRPYGTKYIAVFNYDDYSNSIRHYHFNNSNLMINCMHEKCVGVWKQKYKR